MVTGNNTVFIVFMPPFIILTGEHTVEFIFYSRETAVIKSDKSYNIRPETPVRIHPVQLLSELQPRNVQGPDFCRLPLLHSPLQPYKTFLPAEALNNNVLCHAQNRGNTLRDLLGLFNFHGICKK